MSTAVSSQPLIPHGISDAFSAQLDALWHYGCVVSLDSHSVGGAYLHCAATEPQHLHSNAARLEAANLRPSASTSSSSSASQYDYHAAAPQVKSGSEAAVSSCSHLQSIVHQATSPCQNPHLQRVFNTFDEDGDGIVCLHEICSVFEKLGIESSMDSLVMANLVTTSLSSVDQQGFLSLYESVCCSDTSADMDEDLLAAFHVFDKNGDGFISPAELQIVLCSLGFPQGRQLEDCVEMIARVDDNKDGHVDFSEFKKLFLAENPFMMITLD